MDANFEVSAARAAWTRRVFRIGGLIQAGLATFWLARGGLATPGGPLLAGAFAVVAVGAFAYGYLATADRAPRPRSAEASRIERAITIATVIQLAASFALPATVAWLGRGDWVLPAVAITIGPVGRQRKSDTV